VTRPPQPSHLPEGTHLAPVFRPGSGRGLREFGQHNQSFVSQPTRHLCDRYLPQHTHPPHPPFRIVISDFVFRSPRSMRGPSHRPSPGIVNSPLCTVKNGPVGSCGVAGLSPGRPRKCRRRRAPLHNGRRLLTLDFDSSDFFRTATPTPRGRLSSATATFQTALNQHPL